MNRDQRSELRNTMPLDHSDLRIFHTLSLSISFYRLSLSHSLSLSLHLSLSVSLYLYRLSFSLSLPLAHSLPLSLTLSIYRLSLSLSRSRSLYPSLILYVYLSDVRDKVSCGGNHHWLRRRIGEPSGLRGIRVSSSLLLLASPLMSTVFSLAR